MRIATLLLLLLLAGLVAPAQARQPEQEVFSGVGTIRYLGLATHKYAIVADDGAILEPTSLKQQFAIDNLRVRFSARLLYKPAPLIAGARVVKITKIRALQSAQDHLDIAGATRKPATPRLPKY